MESSLYGVGGIDPLTFGGIPILVMLVAVVAACLPTRRAARIDPIAALRA